MLYAPVHVPRTVAYTPELSAALQATAADQVAWVTFTSANAVRACTELWGEHFAHVLNAADARLACVGKATAAELERCGIEPDYIPHTQSAMGMLAGFPTGDRQQDEPDTVWVVEGQNARPTLREGLGALGFRVMRTVVYRMEPAAEADLAPGELGRDAAVAASGARRGGASRQVPAGGGYWAEHRICCAFFGGAVCGGGFPVCAGFGVRRVFGGERGCLTGGMSSWRSVVSAARIK